MVRSYLAIRITRALVALFSTAFLGIVSFPLTSVPALAAGADPNKVVLLALRCQPNQVTVRHAFVKDFPYVPRNTEGNYRYHILALDDAVLHSGSFNDPHDILIDDFSDPAHPKGGKGRRDIAEIILKIPYFPDAASIRFERQDSASGAWTDLGTSRLKFSH